MTGRMATHRRGVRHTALVVAVLVGLAMGAAACSSTPPSASAGSHPGPKGKGLYLYSYKTSLGTVVGSIAGVVAYADKDESGGKVACTGSCTTTWQPWLTGGKPVHAGDGVRQHLIGSVKRPGGEEQMTYGGHPLYLYAHSKHALQANAQGAGGVWYVVGTDGKIVT